MVRIGGSTYSKRLFPPQVEFLRDVGFDYFEIDLTWLEPGQALQSEALTLAEILPIETAHLPPSRFTRGDQQRFQQFLDYTAMAGPKIYNVHLTPSRLTPNIPLPVRTEWLRDPPDAPPARGPPPP